MKTYLFSIVSVLATSSLIITTASCSDRKKEADPGVNSAEVSSASAVNTAPAPTLPPPAIAPTPVVAAATPDTSEVFTRVSTTLDNVSRAQVSVLTTLPDSLNQSIDASIAARKAQGGTSTNMSESKFDLARTDFIQKVRTLSLAGDDTWKSAKSDAQSSLESLRVAYGEMMAGKEQN